MAKAEASALVTTFCLVSALIGKRYACTEFGKLGSAVAPARVDEGHSRAGVR